MHFLRKHFLLFVFSVLAGTLFLFVQKTEAQSLPRTVQQYKTLFGKNFTPSDDEIKNATASGILYLGPVSQGNGGFDNEGNVKKIRTLVSLKIAEPSEMFRPWNMVAASFRPGPAWIENKTYLRLLDESFVVRVYQKDGANIINESINYTGVTNYSFIQDRDIESFKQGKPLPYIFKYTSGSAAFSNFWNNYADGYNATPGSENTLLILPGGGAVLATKQTALLDFDVSSSKLEKGKPTYLELWYKGGNATTAGGLVDATKANLPPSGANDTPLIPDPATFGDPRIKDFGFSSGSLKYPFFQIGKTIEFQTPKDLNEALSQEYAGDSAAQNLSNNVATNRGSLPVCGILNGFLGTGGSFMGCVGLLSYYLIFKPISFFAWLMGQIFDFFIGYSISDEAYRHDFVLTAWRLVRDISNIFFIIIMIWTGLSAVFSTSNTSYKRVIPTLIINALIINFSLFITQLAIDASNITARLFYNRIEVCKQEEGGSDCNEKSGPAGVKSISEAIVSSFNPQKIFTDSRMLAPDDSLAQDTQTTTENVDFNGAQSASTATTGLSAESNRYGAYFTLVSLLMAMISLGVGLMFWKTAFMFVGRIIGLYVAMIFSPFAFLSRDIPMLGSVSGINYKSWIKDLTGYALLAPVFVFFLYIIGQFLQTKFFSALGLDQNTGNFFETVMYITIPMLIIYGLINKGVGIAKKFSGEFGEMVQNFATKAVGFTAGAALMAGGAGIAKLGTGVGARLGKSLGNSRVGSWAAKNAESNWFARKMSNGLDWSQKSSWDVRNTKLGGMMKSNAMFSAMGINTGAGTKLGETIGLGGKQFEGGAIAMAKRRAEEKKKKYENRISGFSYLTDDQAKRVWEQKRDAQAGEDAARNYLNTTDDEFKNKTAELKAAEKSVKELEKKIREAEDDLKKENKLSEKDKDKLKTTLDNDKKSLKEKKDTVESIQGVQLKAIQDLRDEMKQDKEKEHAVKSSESYDKAYKDAIKAQDKKFGKVDSKDSLANASRRLYFEDLQKNGFWTSRFGKLLPVNAGALTGLTAELQSLLQASLGGWSLAVGGVVGGVVGDMLQSDKEAFEEATSSFLKDYKKKTNKGDAYKDRLKDINDMLKEQIAAHMEVSKDDINLDEMSAEEQKSAIKERVEDLYAEMKASEEDYKKAADAYKATGDKKAFKEAAKATQKAKDLYEKMKSAWEDRIKTEENINKADQNKK